MVFENFIYYITSFICNTDDVELLNANKWVAYALSLLVLTCIIAVTFWIVWRLFSLVSMSETITKESIRCDDGYKIKKKKKRF